MLAALLHQPSFVGGGVRSGGVRSGGVHSGGVRSGACTAAPYTAAVCQKRQSRTPQAAAEELPGLTFEDMCSAHTTSLATLTRSLTLILALILTLTSASWVREAGGEDLTLTYGEITPAGFRTLAQRLRLSARDVFADLGSGHGKAVVQAVAEMGVRAGVGVEIAPPRHERAVALRGTLPAAEAARLTFVLGDCADAALWATAPLAEATAVYVASLLFDKPLLERVAARLAAAPQLRTVATLRRFPSGLRGFDESEPCERCEMSWTENLHVPGEPGGKHPGSPVHIYTRKAPAQSVAEMRALLDSELDSAVDTDGLGRAFLIT